MNSHIATLILEPVDQHIKTVLRKLLTKFRSILVVVAEVGRAVVLLYPAPGFI